jgi:ABC-2 type transport system permease protein
MANPLGTWTLFKRETKRFLKVWMQTIASPVFSNLLYFAIFGLSLRSAVPIEGEGITYLQFLVPGLIVMGLINNAYQNPTSSIMIMKYQGLIADMMTIPLTHIEKFIAFTSSAIIRGMLVGAVTLITSLFFVSFDYHSITIIIFSSLMISFFFACFGIVIGIWADEFDRQAFIQTFILTPLIFLGGVFYPVTKLPGIFQTASLFNPIVYMIDLLRYGFTGVSEFPVNTSILLLSGFTLAMALFSYFLMRSGYKLQN